MSKLQAKIELNNRHGVSLRRFPFPYKAALTICSDIDDTKTLDRFLEIQDFLNTQRNTSLGSGIGLEIGNSFFPYTPDDSFAFFSSRRGDQDVIITLIKAGYIDSIHSYGDGVTNRSDMMRALEAFEKNNCKLDVWIDHSKAPSNFGKDTTRGQGDIPSSPIYHADMTLAYGIKFVWKGRGSSIVGHGIPFSSRLFTQIFDKNYPISTGVNIAKELLKSLLAHMGNKRFALHRNNSLIRATKLEDGQPVYEFQRCNNYWQGLSFGHNINGLAYVIRPQALNNLINSEGTMIIYTHLGVGPSQSPYIPQVTKDALISLSNFYHRGDIYITTTSKLLNYTINQRYLNWVHETLDDGSICIKIKGVNDPIFGFRRLSQEEAQGITFYVPDAQRSRIFLDEKELIGISRNQADHTGMESVSIPRTFLIYPFNK